MVREYGLLLPHFGSNSSRDRIIRGSITAEDYGFDSVWARDHIVYHPHPHEDPDLTHVDPFISLSAIAGSTTKISLGTGVLIPHRHPIHTALLAGSLDFIAGPSRLQLGVGVGTYDHEFDAVGMQGLDRRRVLEEQVEIMRGLWSGKLKSHEGDFYGFSDVEIMPRPVSSDVPLWYGGNSPAAVRRAVEYCNGWLPGRIPGDVYVSRMRRMKRLAEEAGRTLPKAGNIPYVVPGDSIEDALKYVNVPVILEETNRFHAKEACGPFETVADLKGALIAGNATDIIEGVRYCQSLGADLIVFDLRLRFAEWEDSLSLIGEEVLPVLRREDSL